jgi:isoamylase
MGSEHHEVDRRGAFFDILCQDPVLCQVKLIAEPWDLGEGGYQVGNFPPGWAEWNGRYRDVLRAYWKGDGGLIGELAYRFAGSSDLYEYDGRQPHASINYVTSHDGFTLHDLVSYNRKHNELNREGNRDGEDHNISWNCGVEGPTRNAHINGLRARQKRNFLAILLLSQGVPMLLAGDETGRTQQGNNNAYCQDNAISWVNWQLTQEDEALLRFVQRVVGLRKRHSAFRRRHFFRGQATQGARVKDITWLSPEGHEMTDNAWNQSLARCLGLLLGGDAIGEVDECGRQVHDDNLLLLLNAHGHDIAFPIPRHPPYARWEVLIDTSYATGKRIDGRYFHSGESYPLKTRSLVLLVHLMTRHRPGLLGY